METIQSCVEARGESIKIFQKQLQVVFLIFFLILGLFRLQVASEKSLDVPKGSESP